MKLKKWQEKYLQDIAQMSNEHLFDEYMFIFPGDGEDGYSSDENDWKIKQCWNLLKDRFIECGFFKVQ